MGETGDKMRDNIKSHQTAAGKCIFDGSAQRADDIGERVWRVNFVSKVVN